MILTAFVVDLVRHVPTVVLLSVAFVNFVDAHTVVLTFELGVWITLDVTFAPSAAESSILTDAVTIFGRNNHENITVIWDISTIYAIYLLNFCSTVL